MKIWRRVGVVLRGALCIALASVPIIGQAQEKHGSAVEIPTTAAGKLLSQWLEAFNSGSKDKIQEFQSKHLEPAQDPAGRLNRALEFSKQTGGFELVKIETSSEKEIIATAKEKNSAHRARLSLHVSEDNSEWVGEFSIRPIQAAETEPPPPAKKPVNQLVQDVDGKLAKLAADDKFSGAALVAKDGQVLWEKAYGLADRTAKIPNTVNTRFRLGSMNKMFTSVAIAQLVQQGKLKYGDTIIQVLPDYPNKEVASKVTVEQLLTHTSGLGDFFGPQFDQKKDSLHELKDYLPLFAGKPLEFEPGKDWQYSNAGFLVLGLIIERLSSQSYYDYVQKYIYDVAGMKDSGSPPESQRVPNVAEGYTRGEGDDEGGPLKPNTDTLPWRGSSAGGGSSTVGDLLKFDQALRNYKLVSPEMTHLITTGKVHPPRFPDGVKYAYGFGERVIDGNRVVGHAGGAPGMNGELDMHVDTGYTVVVLANRDPQVAEEWSRYISSRLPVTSARAAK
jgi:CubicO group peptidase (beta-lactamase class C family)